MALNNDKLHKIGAIIPDETSTLSAPTIAEGDLSGVTFVDSYNEFVGKRWGAVKPVVQVALLGLNAQGSVKCTAWSTPVDPASALTANQALKITVPKEGIPKGTLGFLVAVDNGDAGVKRIVKQALVPGAYVRNNIAPSADVELIIPMKPHSGLDLTTKIDALIAGDSAPVYGGTYYDIGIELGATGRSSDHTSTSWETESNNNIYTFPGSSSFKVSFNVNAMTSEGFRRLLNLIGYNPTGDEYHFGTIPNLETVVLDMDCSPQHETGSKIERRLIWTASLRTLDAAKLVDSYKSKDGQDIVLSTFPSEYLPFGHTTVAFEAVA